VAEEKKKRNRQEILVNSLERILKKKLTVKQRYNYPHPRKVSKKEKQAFLINAYQNNQKTVHDFHTTDDQHPR
jgi:hypothetical protein